jgi:acyl-CoA hydrolase
VIEDEAFDLLTLAAFGHHSGQAVPASATTGFARFLRFMTTFDFENDAVIVDPQGMVLATLLKLRTLM